MTGYSRVSVAVVAIAVALLASACAASASPPTPAPTAAATPTATAAQTPNPTPSSAPSPSLCALPVTSAGPVAVPAGTCTAADPFPMRLTVTVPAGWAGNIGGPNLVLLAQANGPGGVAFSVNTKVFADPCHTDKGFLDPQPGSSVDDLATALASLPGLTATTPTVVTLGGYQGKQLTLTAPVSASGCTGGDLGVWQLPLGAITSLSPGDADRVWILDVAGQRLVIDALETPGDTTATTEVQRVLDSIHIAPLH